MSESIKKKALRGVAWSAVEKFLRQGLMTLFSILIGGGAGLCGFWFRGGSYSETRQDRG